MTLTGCSEVHREYDRHANGLLQLGPLPDWMHVNGKTAWYVYQGSYRGLPEAWAKFGRMLQALKTEKFTGPPGDVYVSDPMDRQGPAEVKKITILWAPLRE